MVAGGRRVPLAEVRGVLMLLSAVHPVELSDVVVAADRDYVAAEMTAFLLAWSAALPCPVVNRPSPEGLAGPCWRRERWLVEASRTGLRIRPFTRVVPHTHIESAAAAEVVVVGGEAVGSTHPTLEKQTVRLAQRVGAGLLVARYDAPHKEGRFVEADPTPDLASRTEIRRAVLSLLARWAGGVR